MSAAPSRGDGKFFQHPNGDVDALDEGWVVLHWTMDGEFRAGFRRHHEAAGNESAPNVAVRRDGEDWSATAYLPTEYASECAIVGESQPTPGRAAWSLLRRLAAMGRGIEAMLHEETKRVAVAQRKGR